MRKPIKANDLFYFSGVSSHVKVVTGVFCHTFYHEDDKELSCPLVIECFKKGIGYSVNWRCVKLPSNTGDSIIIKKGTSEDVFPSDVVGNIITTIVNNVFK